MSRLFTVKQTAKILGFSTNTIYKYLDQGTIKAIRAGKKGRFRIPQEALEKYLGSQLPTKKELTPIPTTTPNAPPAPEKPTLALTAIRLLLLLTLIILILDIVLNPHTSFLTQALRLLVVFVFLLLAYQFGGKKQ